jgi:hypothetical protein
LIKTLLPRKQPNIKQELPVNKKRLVTAAFISILLMSQVAGIQFVNLARADATTFSDISLGTILPDSNTKPPVVSVFAPENHTVYATNTISLSVNVSVGESSTAYSKYIGEVYYKTDWQINNTYIYESNPTKSLYSTEPAQFSKTMNLTGIPDGNHSLVVYAKERGAYHSHSEYSPPVWYFYYYLFEIDGSSTVFFTVDTTAPRITVLSLEKQTFYTSSVPLNFTVNELTTQIKYSLDGQENATIAGNETLTNLPYGDHNIIVFATDEAGNTGASETITFTVAVPFLTALVIASVITVAVVGIGLLVYFKKRKH